MSEEEEQLEEFKLSIIVRRATAADMPEVAAVFAKSRAESLPFLPQLHTPEEDIEYFSNTVFASHQVFVAVSDDNIVDKRNDDKRSDDERIDDPRIVGFIAFDSAWVHHLYLLPDHQNMRLGARLLDLAKEHSSRLQLWVFQKNARALAFYARNGFRVLKETDGAENEEKEPDAILEWSS